MRYQKEKSLFGKPKSGMWVALLAVAAVGVFACTYYVAVSQINGKADKEMPKNTGDSTLWSTKLPNSQADQPDLTQKKPSDSQPDASLSSTQPSSQQNLSDEPDSPQSLPTSAKLQFILPASGEIINHFSGDTLVKDATLGDWRTHNGIDIAAAAGCDVFAAGDGVVQNIEDTDLWGTVVTLTFDSGHVGVYSLLAPDTDVKIGQKVLLGDKIGHVGDTKTAIYENALDSHLHFEMKKDGKFVDPTSLIG